MEDLREKTPGEVYEALGIDGQMWARHYLSVIRQSPHLVFDESFMESWFCNAIMTGYDAGLKAAKQNLNQDPQWKQQQEN